MFVGEKKSSPEAFSADIELELGPHLKTMQHHKDKDTAYYLTKSPPDNLLPSWTGFNQLLQKEIPQKATIGYLPVVDASPTELNTVNTILHRSVEIANQLELPSVAVVVDQAIYAKAQTMRWQTPVFLERIVLRLGAFHTTRLRWLALASGFEMQGYRTSSSSQKLLRPVQLMV